jgi:hypothetical protein
MTHRFAGAWKWLAGRWVALDLDARDLEFFVGLALIGFAPWRLAVVGAVLVLHAVFGGALVARLARGKE